MITIARAIRIADFDAVEKMQKDVFVADECVELTGTTWWVARDNGTPIGFIGLQVEENYGYIATCGVLPSHRGLGLQRRLIKRTEAFAWNNNLREMVTYTLPGNSASSNNFIALGYKLYEPEDPFAGDDAAIYWFKNLT